MRIELKTKLNLLPLLLITVTILPFVLPGCTLVRQIFDDRGVPLEQFSAVDGRYFPDFIEKFFDKSRFFYRDFPSVTEARVDLRIIEIKQLTTGKSSFNEANLSWSADGVYLGYEVITNKDRRILLKDLVGDYSRDLFVIPKKQNTFLEGMVSRSVFSYNAGLRWSRDSTRYAFMSNGGVGEYNIYVGAVGRKEEIVAKSPTKDGYATWSPRTNEIAFVSSRSGSGDIYMVELDDKRVSRLSLDKEVDIFPEWFPSGQKLVYASGDALNHDLMVLERDTSSKKWKRPYRLTSWNRDDLRPTVSPDGKLIAFYSQTSGAKLRGKKSWNIYVIPYVSGHTYGSRELNRMAVAKNVVIDLNTGPAWSPDSRKVFYVSEDPSKFNPIYGYDLFTGRTYLLKTGTRMNRDILVSRLGVLSFRAQVGAWDKVFVALTNQGDQLQSKKKMRGKIHYLPL